MNKKSIFFTQATKLNQCMPKITVYGAVSMAVKNIESGKLCCILKSPEWRHKVVIGLLPEIVHPRLTP